MIKVHSQKVVLLSMSNEHVGSLEESYGIQEDPSIRFISLSSTSSIQVKSLGS